MKTITLTNNQAQNLYFMVQYEFYSKINDPKKHRLLFELEKIGGFDAEWCGKTDFKKDPYKNKNHKPTLVLFPEVEKWLKKEVGDLCDWIKHDSYDIGTINSLNNLLKKLNP